MASHRITYDVLGFGPKFRLIIKMSSMSKFVWIYITCPNILFYSSKSNEQRSLAFLYNFDEYEFTHRILPVPSAIQQSQWITFSVGITCRHPEKQLTEEVVQIILIRSDWSRAIWRGTFNMPLSEPDIFWLASIVCIKISKCYRISELYHKYKRLMIVYMFNDSRVKSNDIKI